MACASCPQNSFTRAVAQAGDHLPPTARCHVTPDEGQTNVWLEILVGADAATSAAAVVDEALGLTADLENEVGQALDQPARWGLFATDAISINASVTTGDRSLEEDLEVLDSMVGASPLRLLRRDRRFVAAVDTRSPPWSAILGSAMLQCST